MFEYNADDTLKDEITANGQYINYEYTPDGEKLLEMNATVDGNLNQNLISRCSSHLDEGQIASHLFQGQNTLHDEL